TTTRPRARTVNPWAAAVIRLPTASSSAAATRTRRRSRSPIARATKGAANAATTPVTARLNPAVPAEIPSPADIGVRMPTGSISAVTTRNVDSASTAIADQRSAGSAAGTRDSLTMDMSPVNDAWYRGTTTISSLFDQLN